MGVTTPTTSTRTVGTALNEIADALAADGASVQVTVTGGTLTATIDETTLATVAEQTAVAVAPSAALPTKALQVGGVGKDAAPSPATDGTAVRAWFSRAGVAMAQLRTAAGVALDVAVGATAPTAGILAGVIDSTGKLAGMLLDGAGNLLVSAATRFAGENMAGDYLAVRQRFAYVPCAATATTVVAAVPCFVHSILVIPGASGTVLVYDAASATGSAVLSITHSATAPAPFTLILDAQFTTGCTVVLGTAGTALVTAE